MTTRGDETLETYIAIIGSGFGGLGAAVRLKQQGIEDFIILERAGDLGGTWRDNTYPGCACDVQSHLYSFSFAPNPEWSRSFSPQPEIWAYLKRCARDFNLLPHIRFNHEVRECLWDDGAKRWIIETSAGRFKSSVLIMAAGALSEPSVPELPGLETFKGKVFHSARWDHEFKLEGSRVAVIGTGASAIQFVPQIQPVVEKLYLFQRTPPWIVPRHDRRLTETERRLFRRFPLLQRFARLQIYLFREIFFLGFRHLWLARQIQRLALSHLKKSVPDPLLRAKLTPSYAIGCKRVLISNDYLPALVRPNVELVTEGIREVREHSIISRDGVERAVDAIILATGFHVTDPPMAKHVRGRTGQTLAEIWAGSPQAHLGTTIAGFPNLFVLLGPNTGLGHNSVVYMIEAQIEHVMKVLGYMRAKGVGTIEPRAEAQAEFVEEIERRMKGTVWVAGGCASWYLDPTGRNSTIWPDFTWRFRKRVMRMNPQDFLMHGSNGAAEKGAAI